MRLTGQVGISLLLAATTLAGCAAGAETIATSAPTGTTASTTDPAPTATTTAPAPLSRKQAAKRYLDIVRPYNEALERLEKAVNNREPLARQKALAAYVAEKLRAEIVGLEATAWPAKVQRHVDDLVTSSRKALKLWRKAARAQTPHDMVHAVLAASTFDGTEPASKIRKILDLDSYDEDDYS